jgi:hypothetical protein
VNVPILDEQYMERRRAEQIRDAQWQALSRSWGYHRRPDTPESLRDEYARGALTYEQFEQRLDEVLR